MSWRWVFYFLTCAIFQIRAGNSKVLKSRVLDHFDYDSKSNKLFDDFDDILDNVGETFWNLTFKWRKLAQDVLERFKQLCTAKISTGLPPKRFFNDRALSLSTFDARLQWEDCDSISKITDQGACGSCWAISAAHVMTDRLCIHSGGNVTDYISAQNLLTCTNLDSGGCLGADPANAWRQYETQGITTGGFNPPDGCQPYSVEPCNHIGTILSIVPPCGDLATTPECRKDCFGQESGSPIKLKAQRVYQVLKTADIMREITENGPVQATIIVFSSFAGYVSGVYRCPSSDALKDPFLGYHAIRILGWGVEDDVPFWLCSNSWGTDWGEDGYFKIKQGSGKTEYGEGECGIESYVLSGLPQL